MQTNNTDVHSQYLGHTESAPTQGVCALLVYHCLSSRLLYRELSEAGPGLHALPRSKPLRFRYSGLHKGADSVGPEFCALPTSKQLR